MQRKEGYIPIEAHSMRIGELITSSTKYKVPDYQRPFSWDKNKHIKELWEDILAVIEEERPDHFLGAMIFYNRDKVRVIVDGQQRLASLTMLIAAIRDHYLLLNDKDEAMKIQLRRIDYEHEGEYILELNYIDKDFFRKYIQTLSEDPISKFREMVREAKEGTSSHTAIYEAYKFFFEQIKSITDKCEDIRCKKEKLRGLYDKILNNLYVVSINLINEDDAYIVFETLNERGTPLTTADMLKNYVLSIASNEQRESIRNIWHRIEEVINEIVRSTKSTRDKVFDDFLRWYCIYSYKKATSRNLYPVLKESINYRIEKGYDLRDILEEIEKDVKNFKKIILPKGKWDDENIENMLLDLIDIIGMRQHIRLLIPAARLPIEEFEKWVKLCYTIGARFILLYGKGNPRSLERPFDIIAKELYNYINSGKYTSFEEFLHELFKKHYDIEGKLKELYFYENEEKLIESIKNTLFRGPRQERRAKYLLIELNKSLLSKETKEVILPSIHDDGARNIELEHIIPKSLVNKIGYYVFKLGNLTIIYGRWNKEMSNKEFNVKREYYKKSKIPTTRELSEKYVHEDWNIDNIERVQKTIDERTEELAKGLIELFRYEVLENIFGKKIM